MLRKHQQKMQEIAAVIRRGGDVKNILANVTPGGGKSGLAMIVAKELAEPLGYKICWIVPRDSLRKQGERDFVAKRNLFGHTTGVRASGNDINPSGDEGGCIVTYQAVTANPDLWVHEFKRRDYILILDECHHVPDKGDSIDDDAAYFAAIAPLVELAKIRIFASGTLKRHDRHAIAFIPYEDFTNAKSPARMNVPGWAFIHYSRTDALEERAIVPLHFHVMDGVAQWFDERGNIRTVESMARANMRDRSKVLRTSLETKYALELIDKCLADWQSHKQSQFNRAKMLVIAPRQDIARQYLKHINGTGVRALLAISDMDDEAKHNIDRFKRDMDVLVTVGMAAEGLDVPEITHVALLTQIRSEAYIEQAICRANRTVSGKTHGYIYAPDDTRLKEIIDAVQREQAAVVVMYPPEPKQQRNGGGGAPIDSITPIASFATGARGVGLEDGTETNYDETAALESVMQQFGATSISIVQMKQMLLSLGVGVIPNGSLDEPDYSKPVLESTPSERETNLRKTINRQVKQLAQGDAEKIQRINGRLKQAFGSRDNVRENTLHRIVTYIADNQSELKSL